MLHHDDRGRKVSDKAYATATQPHLDLGFHPCTNPHYCQECGKILNPTKMVWVEWDWRTGPVFGPVEERYSQGWFAYGSDCIRAIKAELAAQSV